MSSSPARALLLCASLLSAPAWGQDSDAPPQTPCEVAEFKAYTSYAAMMDYLQEVQSRSTENEAGVLR